MADPVEAVHVNLDRRHSRRQRVAVGAAARRRQQSAPSAFSAFGLVDQSTIVDEVERACSIVAADNHLVAARANWAGRLDRGTIRCLLAIIAAASTIVLPVLGSVLELQAPAWKSE